MRRPRPEDPSQPPSTVVSVQTAYQPSLRVPTSSHAAVQVVHGALQMREEVQGSNQPVLPPASVRHSGLHGTRLPFVVQRAPPPAGRSRCRRSSRRSRRPAARRRGSLRAVARRCPPRRGNTRECRRPRRSGRRTRQWCRRWSPNRRRRGDRARRRPPDARSRSRRSRRRSRRRDPTGRRSRWAAGRRLRSRPCRSSARRRPQPSGSRLPGRGRSSRVRRPGRCHRRVGVRDDVDFGFAGRIRVGVSAAVRG